MWGGTSNPRPSRPSCKPSCASERRSATMSRKRKMAARTDLSSGMAVEKRRSSVLPVLLPPNPQPTQRQRQCIADRQRCHDAVRRCRQRRIGLVRRPLRQTLRVHTRRGIEPSVARLREDRLGVPRDGDEGAHPCSYDREEAHQLGGCARVGDHEEGVAGGGGGAGAHDAEVAVEGFEGVEEDGLDACEMHEGGREGKASERRSESRTFTIEERSRRARGRTEGVHRCDHLATDDPALADSRYEDLAV